MLKVDFILKQNKDPKREIGKHRQHLYLDRPQATSLALKCRHQKNYFQIDFQYISRWQIIYSIYIADSKSMFAL
jgi:hypothetical protein